MPPKAEIPVNGGADANDSAEELFVGEMSVEDQISGLLAMIEDHPHDVDLVGMSLQYLVALSQEHREQVMATDAVTKVFGIMQNHGNHENMMEGCLFFLVGTQLRSMLEPETIPLIHQTDRVEAIVAVMNTFQDSTGIQRNGSLILSPLGGGDQTRDVMLETEALSALIFAMARLPNDNAVQHAGCFSILELLENDRDGQIKEEISKAGGIVVLFTFLKRYCDHPVSQGDNIETIVLKSAFEAISLLSKDSDSVKTSILDMDGIAILLAFIKRQTLNPSLQFEVMQILRNFGDCDSVCDAFVAAGGVSTLATILKESPDNETLVGGVLVAFVGLTANSPVMADAIALDGTLAAIVSIMPRYIDNVHLQAFFIGAIGVCISAEGSCHVQDAIRAISNVVRCVVATMRKYADDEDIQATGTMLLRDLAFSLKMVVDIAQNGGLLILAKAMNKFPLNLDLQVAAFIIVDNTIEGTMLAKSKNIDVPVDLIESIKVSGVVPAIVNILNLPLGDDMLCHDLIVCLRKMAEMNADIKQQIIVNEGIKLLGSKDVPAEQATILLNLLNDSDNENNRHGGIVGHASQKAAT